MKKIEINREALETVYQQAKQAHVHPGAHECAVCDALAATAAALVATPKGHRIRGAIAVAALTLIALSSVGWSPCHDFGLGIRVVNQQTGKPNIEYPPPFPCEGVGCSDAGP